MNVLNQAKEMRFCQILQNYNLYMNSMNPTTYNKLSKYAYFILCVQLYSISSLSSAGNGETF